MNYTDKIACTTAYECETNDRSIRFCNFNNSLHGYCEPCQPTCERVKFQNKKGVDECDKICEGNH